MKEEQNTPPKLSVCFLEKLTKLNVFLQNMRLSVCLAFHDYTPSCPTHMWLMLCCNYDLEVSLSTHILGGMRVLVLPITVSQRKEWIIG